MAKDAATRTIDAVLTIGIGVTFLFSGLFAIFIIFGVLIGGQGVENMFLTQLSGIAGITRETVGTIILVLGAIIPFAVLLLTLAIGFVMDQIRLHR